ncbi:hypothetical protein K491DRAFT_685799 [Lophiostoma macrostomum CBS 122681]|uniref:Uncharacterized protein n=1 Tax=Lophiostoma macrostomum CBS 122681 TaxID=1314788 RepID=A0A6A6SI69_9PLEO|nr:hypothetical protein K491DRAFT_685799 [Lophiostoma macrostomum CBS 122681]
MSDYRLFATLNRSGFIHGLVAFVVCLWIIPPIWGISVRIPLKVEIEIDQQRHLISPKGSLSQVHSRQLIHYIVSHLGQRRIESTPHEDEIPLCKCSESTVEYASTLEVPMDPDRTTPHDFRLQSFKIRFVSFGRIIEHQGLGSKDGRMRHAVQLACTMLAWRIGGKSLREEDLWAGCLIVSGLAFRVCHLMHTAPDPLSLATLNRFPPAAYMEFMKINFDPFSSRTLRVSPDSVFETISRMIDGEAYPLEEDLRIYTEVYCFARRCAWEDLALTTRDILMSWDDGLLQSDDMLIQNKDVLLKLATAATNGGLRGDEEFYNFLHDYEHALERKLMVALMSFIKDDLTTEWDEDLNRLVSSQTSLEHDKNDRKGESLDLAFILCEKYLESGNDASDHLLRLLKVTLEKVITLKAETGRTREEGEEMNL